MKSPGYGMGKRVVDHGGAGKGSANRTTNSKTFQENMDQIDFGRGPGVAPARGAGKWVKRYGSTEPEATEKAPHIVIH